MRFDDLRAADDASDRLAEQEVAPQFLAYDCATTDGRSFTGLLVANTNNLNADATFDNFIAVPEPGSVVVLGLGVRPDVRLAQAAGFGKIFEIGPAFRADPSYASLL